MNYYLVEHSDHDCDCCNPALKKGDCGCDTDKCCDTQAEPQACCDCCDPKDNCQCCPKDQLPEDCPCETTGCH